MKLALSIGQRMKIHLIKRLADSFIVMWERAESRTPGDCDLIRTPFQRHELLQVASGHHE